MSCLKNWQLLQKWLKETQKLHIASLLYIRDTLCIISSKKTFQSNWPYLKTSTLTFEEHVISWFFVHLREHNCNNKSETATTLLLIVAEIQGGNVRYLIWMDFSKELLFFFFLILKNLFDNELFLFWFRTLAELRIRLLANCRHNEFWLVVVVVKMEFKLVRCFSTFLSRYPCF